MGRSGKIYSLFQFTNTTSRVPVREYAKLTKHVLGQRYIYFLFLILLTEFDVK